MIQELLVFIDKSCYNAISVAQRLITWWHFLFKQITSIFFKFYGGWA